MRLEIVGIPRGQCEGQRLHAVQIGRSQVAIAIAITVRLSGARLFMALRERQQREEQSEGIVNGCFRLLGFPAIEYRDD